MEGVVQIQAFSDPPAPGDCDALVVPDQDIDAIKKCKSGECDVKITDDMARQCAHIDWSAPGARDRVATAFREMGVAIASGYRSGGIDSLGVIVDKKEPKARAREFQKLLAHLTLSLQVRERFSSPSGDVSQRTLPGCQEHAVLDQGHVQSQAGDIDRLSDRSPARARWC